MVSFSDTILFCNRLCFQIVFINMEEFMITLLKVFIGKDLYMNLYDKRIKQLSNVYLFAYSMC